ncbi:hypothetical protein [Modestobacter sp. I12A-02662]|uniref:hypothetical protein n=1 Tax=Modestobacter sp. I12A-02662 TaxID=1730496 RepID=UPI0034DFFEF3
MLDTTRGEGSHAEPVEAGRTHRSRDAGTEAFHERVAVARRNWRVGLATFLVVLVASLGSLLVVPPVYRAQTEVLLRTQDSQQLFPRTGSTQANALTRSPGAELLYTNSDEFRAVAEGTVPGSPDMLVRNDLGSSALVFVAEADEPEAAARAAQAWADTYIAQRHELDTSETTRLRDLLLADRAAVETQREQVLEPVAALDAVIAAEADPADLSQLLNQRLAVQRSLAPQLEPLDADLRRLDDQVAALDVDLRVLEDPNALAVVTQAPEVPESRVNGSLTQSLAVGVLGGLVLAAAAVTVADRLRSR